MTLNTEQRQSHANPPAFGESRLDMLQHHAFEYFLLETNPANGLVADRSEPGAPASIAAVGFALAVYLVGVERGWMTRTDAIERTLALMRFFWTSPQGTAPDATGHNGFYYHFLDMTTGRRAGLCELSTVDSSFLLAGMLAAAAFFDRDSEDEQKIRTLADALYRRADWIWACNGDATVTHGWTPESGFLPRNLRLQHAPPAMATGVSAARIGASACGRDDPHHLAGGCDQTPSPARD